MTISASSFNNTAISQLNTPLIKSEKNFVTNKEKEKTNQQDNDLPKVNGELARVIYNIKTNESKNTSSKDSNIIKCSDEISNTFKGFLSKFGNELSDTLGEELFTELKQVSGFAENMVNAYKNIKKGKNANENIDKAINYAKSTSDVVKAGSILATGIAGIIGSTASLGAISAVTVGLAGLSTIVIISLLAYKYYNMSINSENNEEKQHYKKLAQALEQTANKYIDKITQKLESNDTITNDEKIAALSYLKLASLVESATKNVPLTKVNSHKKFEKLAVKFGMDNGNSRMLINNYLCNNISKPEDVIEWVTQNKK